MQRIILGAIVLTLLSAPAAIAAPFNSHVQSHHVEAPRHVVVVHAPVVVRHNSWSKGKRVPLAQRRHFIDYRHAHLRAPGRGQQWVQVDNQYLLINISTGLIASIFGAK